MRREEFTRKVRAAALKRAEMQCEHREGSGVDEWRCQVTSRLEFDHVIPAEFGGEATLENCRVLCRAHHKTKTAVDIRDIRKSDRIRDKHTGAKKPRHRWGYGRGDPLKKKLDGTVVER